MNYSPSYRAKKLGEIQARLREVGYDLGRLLETAQCSEIRQIDELVLAVDSLLVDARAAERRPVQPAAPLSPHKIVPAVKDGGRS